MLNGPNEGRSSLHGSSVVDQACRELGYNLAKLVALTSIWINPKVVRLLDPADGVWYPFRRRANLGLRSGGKQVESVGQVIAGITLDNNTYANTAFKQALGVARQEFTGFHICHIWRGTAYDPACFTQMANLVGIPAELSSLTDYHPHISACLRFRAWDLYRWKPRKEIQPVKPAEYPERWREPHSANEMAIRAAKRRAGTVASKESRKSVATPGLVPQQDPRPPRRIERLAVADPKKRQAIIAALYLARFNHEALGFGNQDESFKRIADTLSVKKNTLRNYRDFFDANVDSGRKGWWQVPLAPELSAILLEFGKTPEPQLREMVLGFLRGPTEN